MPTKKDLEAAEAAFKRADKVRLQALSEAEIEAAAEADEDNPPASEEELARAWRVTPISRTAAE